MKTSFKSLLVLAFMGALRLPAFAADDPNAPIDPSKYTPPIKICCVGDSITAGVGAKVSYPLQLAAMLGSGWKMDNAGVSATTLLNSGDLPYQRQAAFLEALTASIPNVVVIMLGTNDTKPQNWKSKDHFIADYKDIIDKFKSVEGHPRIFICLPVPVPGAGNYGINEAGIDEEIPMIKSVAADENVGLIDLHTPFAGHDAYFPDRVHPNDAGAHLMAATVYKALTGKDPAP